jgi:hypothetical protein
LTGKHGTDEYDLFGPRRDGVKKGVVEISARKFVATQRVKFRDEVGNKHFRQENAKYLR